MIALVTTLIFITVIICYVFYWLGYRNAMKKAEDMLDEEFEKRFGEANIVVKKDDRIIECNGLASPLMCKECCFSRVHVDGEKWSVECFVPDYDGVPTIGLRKMKGEE